MQRLIRFLTVVSGVFLLLLSGFVLLASSAPGPFHGLIGLLYALAIFIVGMSLLMRRGGVRLYPFAIILPLAPLIYAFVYASAVLLNILPPPPPIPGMDTNWGFVAFLLVPSVAAAIAMLLSLLHARRERSPSS